MSFGIRGNPLIFGFQGCRAVSHNRTFHSDRKQETDHTLTFKLVPALRRSVQHLSPKDIPETTHTAARSYARDIGALDSAAVPTMLNPASPGPPRLSLAFILDQDTTPDVMSAFGTQRTRPSPSQSPVDEEVEYGARPQTASASVTPLPATGVQDTFPRRSRENRRRARACSVDGCPNYTIDRGLCFRHGVRTVCCYSLSRPAQPLSNMQMGFLFTDRLFGFNHVRSTCAPGRKAMLDGWLRYERQVPWALLEAR